MSKAYVLVCTHNGANYIEAQIQSILAQTRAVDYIYIHDFASTDSTVDLVQSLSAKTTVPIFLVKHTDAPGVCLSFFRAIHYMSQIVTNEDIIFLADQDDYWLEDKAAIILERVANSDAGVENLIFHDVCVTDKQLEIQRETYYTGNPYSIPRDLSPERLILSNPVIGHTIAANGKLIKRVSGFATPSHYLMHDWALALFASRFGKISFVDRPLSLYRQHERNVLGAYGRRSFSAIFRKVYRLSKLIIPQAMGFLHDIAKCEDFSPSASDARLEKAKANGHFQLGILLSWRALVTGPTWQRKGLSLFIAYHALRTQLTRTSRSTS